MKKVKECIYRDITSVNEEATLCRVIKTMKLNRIIAVAIINKHGEYTGCVSAQDILTAAVPEYIKSMYNSSFMAQLDQITNHLEEMLHQPIHQFVDKKYPVLSLSDSMSYAADLLYRNKKSILPVIEGRMFVGWISKIDILSVSLYKKDN